MSTGVNPPGQPSCGQPVRKTIFCVPIQSWQVHAASGAASSDAFPVDDSCAVSLDELSGYRAVIVPEFAMKVSS